MREPIQSREKANQASSPANAFPPGTIRVINLDKREEPRVRLKPASFKSDEEKKLNRDLRNNVTEGAFGNFSTSIVSSYSTPYALFLNASNAEIGLMTSLQSLAGLVSQVPGSKLTKSMPRKRIWLICSLVSRLMLIPLIFLALFSGSLAVWVLILSLSAFSFFTSMKTPAWSSIMGDMVPLETRGKYFGKRNMIMGSAGMLATLLAGLMLQHYGFPMVFAFAIAVSSLALVFSSRIREPPMKRHLSYRYNVQFSIHDFMHTIRTNMNFAMFTAYLTFTNFAVNIAAPFIAVYMIKDLDIGYAWFAVVVTTGALSQILSHRHWGFAIDRYGNRKIMIITGILICFIPLGYMLSSNTLELILVKVFDGFVWGAFDLVCFNYLLAVTPSERRPSYVANHNIAVGMGTVLGALLGGFIAQGVESSTLFFLYGIQIVFLISFFLRLLSLGLLTRLSDAGMKEADRVPVRYVFWETVAVGPAKGVEHAITNAFQYPYGVKIRSAFGISSNKRIKIRIDDRRRPSQRNVIAPQEHKKRKGVFGMAIKGSGKEYFSRFAEISSEVERKNRVKILFHRLDKFSDTDRIVRNIRNKELVFVDLKGMKRDKRDELKQSVAKLNKACAESGSRLSLVEEEWLIAAPPGADFV